MRKLVNLLFIGAMLVPAAAQAQDGLYVGLGVGWSFLSEKRTLYWDTAARVYGIDMPHPDDA